MNGNILKMCVSTYLLYDKTIPYLKNFERVSNVVQGLIKKLSHICNKIKKIQRKGTVIGILK